MPKGVYDHSKIRGRTFTRQDVDERFWSKVRLEDPIFPENGCMLWTDWQSHNGYGRFATGPHGSQKKFFAHRWAYERKYGEVPKGLQLDHLCRNRLCVNPDHLEAVTLQVNLMRGETKSSAEMRRCPNGQYGGYKKK